VWRWHFFAGLAVAPFALFLAFTGAIYLWQPQYEAWRYRDLLMVPVAAPTVPADTQLAAARAAAPAGFRAQSYQPPSAAGETAQVVFKAVKNSSPFGSGVTIYVNPYTGAVTGMVRDDDRLMNTVKELHGSLLAGKPGKYVVELAASWALALFVTGLYLAWPRPRFAVWGFLLPRLRASGRTFWRDLHAVPAVWLSLGTIFLLTTGLLWSQGAGQWYRTVSAAIGQGTPRASNAGAHRSEIVGWSPTLKSGLTEKIDALASSPPMDEHAGHGHGAAAAANAMLPPDGPYEHALSLERVIALAREHQVPEPFVVGLPVGPAGVFSAVSDRAQPFRRAFLHLDQYSGRVLADVRFKDFGYLAQFFSWGIIAHEGRLFGLANQILGTLAAAGVILLVTTGVVMWWARRPAGRLAAPAADPLFRVSKGAVAIAVLLSLALPLLAATLAVLVACDRMFGRRLSAAG
jgi:uncharacterized iron-regulated membrane protein